MPLQSLDDRLIAELFTDHDTTYEGAVVRDLALAPYDEHAIYWWWMFRLYGAGRAVELHTRWTACNAWGR